MKEKKRKEEEVRPPIETGGMGFNEVLKRIAQTLPEEVKKKEDMASKTPSKAHSKRAKR